MATKRKRKRKGGVPDSRDFIREHIRNNGLKQGWVAGKLGISTSHFSLVLSKDRDLSKNNRIKINELWGTDY